MGLMHVLDVDGVAINIIICDFVIAGIYVVAISHFKVTRGNIIMAAIIEFFSHMTIT